MMSFWGAGNKVVYAFGKLKENKLCTIVEAIKSTNFYKLSVTLE